MKRNYERFVLKCNHKTEEAIEAIWKQGEVAVKNFMREAMAVTGLLSEAGELAGHWNKGYRDDHKITDKRKELMGGEFEDMGYQETYLRHKYKLRKKVTRKKHCEKLELRHATNTISGYGDEERRQLN